MEHNDNGQASKLMTVKQAVEHFDLNGTWILYDMRRRGEIELIGQGHGLSSLVDTEALERVLREGASPQDTKAIFAQLRDRKKISIPECQRRWKITGSILWKAAKEGYFSPIDPDTKPALFRGSDLATYLEEAGYRPRPARRRPKTRRTRRRDPRVEPDFPPVDDSPCLYAVVVDGKTVYCSETEPVVRRITSLAEAKELILTQNE